MRATCEQLNQVKLTRESIYPGMVLGYRKDGRPIFVIAGGAPEGDGGDGGGDGGSGDQGGAGAGGDGGDGGGGDAAPTAADIQRLQAALDKERTLSREGKVAARELAALKAAQGSETDKAIATAKADAEKATAAKYTDRIVGLSIRGAAKLFEHPSDAAALLRDKYSELLNADGDDADDVKVQRAVDDLLRSRPNLAAAAAKAPDFDNGQRNGKTGGNQSMDSLIRKQVGVTQ